LGPGRAGCVNLRDLRYLVALAEHRHFGRAAEASFVSQPTLSTQIRKLEEELGVALFERAPRKVMLTPVGREIVERARKVLADVDQLAEIARRSQDPEAGTVRLGLFPTLGPYLLPHVLPGLRERFPRLEFLLVEDKTDALLERLRDGRLDAAVLALPLADEQLHAEPLFDEPFVLATPAGHPLAGRGPLAVDDLDEERLLLLEEGHCLREQALDVCRLAGAGERDFRATSLETLRQMVAAGVGGRWRAGRRAAGRGRGRRRGGGGSRTGAPPRGGACGAWGGGGAAPPRARPPRGRRPGGPRRAAAARAPRRARRRGPP